MQPLAKIYGRNNTQVALHAAPGHFVTSHSHINFYIDVTSLKTRANEAIEVAKILVNDYTNTTVIDTIVCLDGTEVIGAYMAQEFERKGFDNYNQHDTIYVVTPEYNTNNQLMFRDNLKSAIKGKNVLVLLSIATTGLTVDRAMSMLNYYGGNLVGVSSIFSTVNEIGGFKVNSVFDTDDLPGYQGFSNLTCPMCKKKIKIDAMVNAYGYSEVFF